jgi:hypothetical protein
MYRDTKSYSYNLLLFKRLMYLKNIIDHFNSDICSLFFMIIIKNASKANDIAFLQQNI